MHKFNLLYTWFIRTVTYWLPDQPVIMRLRGKLYGYRMKSCGRNFQVSSNVILRTLENLTVGDDVYLAPNVVINCSDTITIESEVLIGFNVVVVSSNHSILNGSYRFGTSIDKPIFIGFGSWIGANSTVLAGSYISKSVVIGANSVTNKFVESDGIYAGSPVKCLKKIS
ncbi:acyltransferase [Vibrio sp. A2-1]|uniref:acyltransferase n=1 Tax=Vibrio sp. A2-1 TaxID=2912252 RepID=UPI001F327471|nr:acyltransferase [Vibrio sp. A2-1]